MNDQFNWDDIKVFVAVVETSSLSQAAKVLRMSQPTVGRRIQSLEDSLGFALFYRSPNGYEPTEQAQQLLNHAGTMQNSARRFYFAAQTHTPTHSGRVRVTCGETFGRFLASHADQLGQQHPGVSLDIVTGFDFLNLDKDEADIAIRNQRPDNPNLFVRKLGTSAYAVYGSPDYVSSDECAVQDDRYQKSRWLSFTGDSTTLPSSLWLHKNVAACNINLRFSSPSLLLHAVQQGAGLAPLPCSLAAEDPDLIQLTPLLEDLKNTLWMVLQRDAHRIDRIQRVADWIGDLFESNRQLFNPMD